MRRAARTSFHTVKTIRPSGNGWGMHQNFHSSLALSGLWKICECFGQVDHNQGLLLDIRRVEDLTKVRVNSIHRLFS